MVGPLFRYTWLLCIVKWSLQIQISSANCDEIKDVDWFRQPADRNDGFMPLLVDEWWEIDCRLKNNTVNTTLWHEGFRSGLKHMFVNGTRVIEKSKNIFRITRLRHSDRGKYFCKACRSTKYIGGILVSKGNAFAQPSVLIKPSTDPVSFGTNVTLECSVKGSYHNYDMKWFKMNKDGKHKFLPSTFMSVWISQSNKTQRRVLKVLGFGKNDEGIYMCQIRRYAVQHTARKSVNLTLEGASSPNILFFPPQNNNVYEVAENGNLSIKYNVTGSPKPDVTWYRIRNGKQEKIASFSAKLNRFTSKVSTMTINTFTSIGRMTYLKDNNTTFVCRASNAFGNTSRSFTISIKTKPMLGTEKMSSDRVKLYEQGMSLQCILARRFKDVVFSWQICAEVNYKITSSQCSTEQRWKTLVGIQDDWGSNYTIENQETATAFYRCFATNKMGKDDFIWQVVRLDKASSNNTVTRGGAATRWMLPWVLTTVCSVIMVILLLVILKWAKKPEGIWKVRLQGLGKFSSTCSQ